jgi:signal transduction histidine kinase/CheY-like chemotaxis protein
MPRSRMRMAVALGAALISATLVGGATLVLERTWSTAQENARASLQRTAQAIENTFNRQMLQVDSALAGLPALVGSFTRRGGAPTPEEVQVLLRSYNGQSLLFRDLLLVRPDGSVWASARPRPPNRPLPLSRDELFARASSVAAAVLGPVRNPQTGEWALYMARPVQLPEAGALVALAEVPIGALTSSLSETAGDVPSLLVALETGDGRLLASLPHDERGIGQRLEAPVSRIRTDGVAFNLAEGPRAPGLGAARVALYGDVRVAVTVTAAAAFADWRRDRDRLVMVVLLAELFVLASTGALFWALRRQDEFEEERRQARRRLENAIEAMSDGFVMWDQDDRLVTSNATYRDLYAKSAAFIRPGATFEEIMRGGALNGQYPQAGEDIEAWLADMIAWHRGSQGSIERLLPDGRWLLVTERRTKSGEIVGIRTDITALKAALQDLAAATEQAGRATAEAQAARAAAEAASQAKTEFLASMSHEIRTPLNGILGYTDLLLEDPTLTPDQTRQLERVRSAGAALLTVVNDVLDFSKIESGHVEIEQRPFAPAALLENAVSIVRSVSDKKGLSLSLTTDPALPPLLVGDEDRLRQVLLNLLNNAVKFTPTGEVAVSVTVDIPGPGRCGLRFAVADTGIGIPAEQQGRLFQRFSQVDSSIRREFGGTGLGLAISKHLVGLMGGTIGVESADGSGSTFWFRVELAVADAPRLPDSRPAAAAPPAGTGARILLAEDNEINQEIARTVLEAAGHRVDVVGDGAAAVMAVHGGGYDLVLMDVQMPVMDGLTATKRIRALDGPGRLTPIVAMTANVLPQQVAQFRAAGMDDHVGKPFKREELFAAIERWRRQRSAA